MRGKTWYPLDYPCPLPRDKLSQSETVCARGATQFVYQPLFLSIFIYIKKRQKYDRQTTKRPTNRRTDMVIRKFHFQKKQRKISGRCWYSLLMLWEIDMKGEYIYIFLFFIILRSTKNCAPKKGEQLNNL